MKKILLVDLSTYKGHHRSYFEQILKTLVDHGFHVYCSAADNETLMSFVKKNKLINNVEVVEANFWLGDKLLYRFIVLLSKLFKSSLVELLPVLRIYFLIQRKVGKGIPVFFAHLDSYLPRKLSPKYVNYFLPDKWSGLYITPLKINEVSHSHINHLEKGSGILMLDQSVVDSYRSMGNLSDSIHHLPELLYLEHTSHSLDCQKIQEKAGGRKIITVLGSLGKKRNLILFLQTVKDLPKDKYFILIVGLLNKKQHTASEVEEINSLLAQIKENAHIQLDTYIETEEAFNTLMFNSDLIYLHYKDHPHSSNQLAKAIGMGKPVIVNKGAFMETVVNRYQWMSSCEANPFKIRCCIEYTLQNFDLKNTLHRTFLRDYSLKSFKKSILRVV